VRAAFASARARYASRLEVLAAPEPILEAVRAAVTAWGLEEVPWRRTYGRFEPGRAPFARLVLETTEGPQRILRVDAFEDGPSAVAGEIVVATEAIGWLRLTRFPSDPALATLPGLVASLREFRVVRFRPGSRCTMRVAGNRGARFVKVFPDGRGAALHENAVELHRAADRGELGFGVAAPLNFDPAARALWQQALAGESVESRLFGAAGVPLATRMGRAAATLTRSSLRPAALAGPENQLARARKYRERIGRIAPALGPAAEKVVAQLAALHGAAPARAPRPIHGSPRPRQWLVDGERLALVDFDRFAWGDPELDVSSFVVAAENERAHDVAAAFVQAYAVEAGTLRPSLLTAYLAQRRLGEAEKAVRALGPDGDLRAERKLEHALRCLTEAPA
jgi:hypothetical protein